MHNNEEINTSAEARNRVLQHLRTEACHCATERSPLAVIAVEPDDFDTLIQTEGEAVAAKTLGELLRCMEIHCGRQRDRICRLSDRVIVAICPKTLPAGAHHVASRIRETAEFLHVQDGLPKITLSIGISVAVPDAEDSAERLLSRAENSLKSARESGGHRIVGATPPGPAQTPKTLRSIFRKLFQPKTDSARRLED